MISLKRNEIVSPRSPKRPQISVEKPLSPGKEFTKHIEVRANGYCIYSNKRWFYFSSPSEWSDRHQEVVGGGWWLISNSYLLEKSLLALKLNGLKVDR